MFDVTSAQVHLAINHLPVIGAVLASGVLVLAALRAHATLRSVGLGLLLVAALGALPAYLSGEGTEEIVEHRPGVAKPLIERHERAARAALVAILVGGAAAAGTLAATRLRRARAARVLFTASIIGSVAATALLVRTAHLGGLIRHDELRASASEASTLQARRDRSVASR